MKDKKLHNIKSSGFKVPKDYFKSFDEKLQTCLIEKESMENIETPGFNVPKDYFETFNDNLLEKLQNETPVVQLKPRKKLYYITGIAASLILIFTLYFNQTESEDITLEMVETYFENSNLDSYELAELLSNADMLEDDFVITETPYVEDNLESYLLENADLDILLE
ncbi:hypothetical protein [uncultured Psychroserpens sp.]|uniref:hypothetical protein n=1 Tax=uncultured Psychroserpens sp. TaxID=255436 RepID=UPI0026201B5F|nr:hypothetical protein [uncultured Psychroserpens sp.]